MAFDLDRIQVASPCPASWDSMTGDDRVRFCSECRQQVYNLSDMSRRDAEALLSSLEVSGHEASGREGRTCVRFYRRADGTVMTSDCPRGLRALKRKVALLVSAAAVLLLGVMAWGAAVFTGRARDGDPGPRNFDQRGGLPIWEIIQSWFRPRPPDIVMGMPVPIANPPLENR